VPGCDGFIESSTEGQTKTILRTRATAGRITPAVPAGGRAPASPSSDPNLIGKRCARKKADQTPITFGFARAGRAMFEEESVFAEIVTIVTVSAIAFVIILAFYGWR
jgi:hypothetical protein